MSNARTQLEILLKIRAIRVRKQAAVLASEEGRLKVAQEKRDGIKQSLREEEDRHVKTRHAKLESLMGNQAEIQDFLELKDSENAFDWRRKQLTREGDVLIDQIQQSKVNSIVEKRKLKVLEKASIKIEEHLKLDWT
jgi:hypothetical protein